MKIFITPLFGLGDTLMFTPAIELLKKNKPDCTIDVFTFKKSNCEILLNNPYIDNLLFEPMLSWNKLKTVNYILTHLRGKYDVVINFYPSNRKEYNIFAFLIGARYRLGHRYLHMDLRELNFLKNLTVKEDPHLHCVEENVRLLKLLGVNANTIPEMRVYLSKEEMQQGLKFLEQWPSTKRIGLHTGSSTFKNHVKRRWPKEYFLEVVNYFGDIKFFLFGTNEERKENEFIINNSRYKNVVLVENKTIREVAAIIKNLDLFVSNDSGLMHLSAAVGTKTLGIFGPTNPVWVRPWGKGHIVVKSEMPCAPCFVYSPKPLTCRNPNKWACLKNIKPETVIRKIEEAL